MVLRFLYNNNFFLNSMLPVDWLIYSILLLKLIYFIEIMYHWKIISHIHFNFIVSVAAKSEGSNFIYACIFLLEKMFEFVLDFFCSALMSGDSTFFFSLPKNTVANCFKNWDRKELAVLAFFVLLWATRLRRSLNGFLANSAHPQKMKLNFFICVQPTKH